MYQALWVVWNLCVWGYGIALGMYLARQRHTRVEIEAYFRRSDLVKVHPMNMLHFSFRSSVSREDRKTLLRGISACPGVEAAVPLMSESKDPRIAAMSVVYVPRAEDVSYVMSYLGSLPQVDHAVLAASDKELLFTR